MNRLRKISFLITESKIAERLFMFVSFFCGVIALANPENVLVEFLVYATIAIGAAYFLILYLLRKSDINDLAGSEWHSYHVTYKRGETVPEWVTGRIRVDRHSKHSRISGTHVDVDPPRHEYRLDGHINGSRYLFVERNDGSGKVDDCFAYFVHTEEIRSEGCLAGYWFGPDQNRDLVVAPYILSKRELPLDDRVKISSLLKIRLPEAPGHAAALWAETARLYGGQISYMLPVVFCRFDNSGYAGFTFFTKGTDANPICLINMRDHTRLTLAHEMGHAAGLPKEFTDNKNLMFRDGSTRISYALTLDQLHKIKAAPFHA